MRKNVDVKNSGIFWPTLFLLSLGIAVWVHLAAQGDFHGKVASIADGDTLTILDSANTQFKIRLAEIDAPEIGLAMGMAAQEVRGIANS